MDCSLSLLSIFSDLSGLSRLSALSCFCGLSDLVKAALLDFLSVFTKPSFKLGSLLE